MSKPSLPAFAIVLQAVPGWGAVPPIVRLRRALKSFLRSYGLKCMEIREAPAEESPAEVGKAIEVTR